jgi:hypothetical protein
MSAETRYPLPFYHLNPRLLFYGIYSVIKLMIENHRLLQEDASHRDEALPRWKKEPQIGYSSPEFLRA